MTRLPLALGLLAFAAAAETGSGLVLQPFPEDGTADLRAEVDQYLDSETDSGRDVGMRFAATSGRARLLPDLGRRSPVLGWEAARVAFDSDDARVPDRLVQTAVALGAGFRAGDWVLQGTLGLGFAGDRPFHGNGWYALASASGTRRFESGDILALGLDFDGNRPVFPDVPLPVVIWTRRWSDRLTTSVGFPFLAVRYRPWTRLELAFRGIPGVSQTGSITYRPAEGWDLFVRYRSANFRFFVEELPRDDRLFYEETRVEFGVTARPRPGMEVTLLLGWAFEREFRTGFDVRDTDRVVSFDATAVVGLVLRFEF